MEFIISFLVSGENYANATALVITFTVNNFQNKTFQKMAQAWEKGYLEVLKNYYNPNISVAYTSEVTHTSDQVELCYQVYTSLLLCTLDQSHKWHKFRWLLSKPGDTN